MSVADWINNLDSTVLNIDYNAIQRAVANAYQSAGSGSIHNTSNNSIQDKNGILKENSFFSSYKSIANLSPEQKQKLDDCANEIARIKKVKEKIAAEEEKNAKEQKNNEKTLEQVFKENNLSTDGLSDDLKKTTDYDTIQDEIEKILDKKKDEQDELKKEYFGETPHAELSNIQIENIDKAEIIILNDLLKDVDKNYGKCEQIEKQINELNQQKNIELKSASQITNIAQRTDKLEAINQKYAEKEAKLREKKAQATDALEKAREKVTNYGEKAAKNKKTIGSDGKEIKTSSSTSAQKFSSEA